jgi:hypothetical protein
MSTPVPVRSADNASVALSHKAAVATRRIAACGTSGLGIKASTAFEGGENEHGTSGFALVCEPSFHFGWVFRTIGYRSNGGRQ